MAKECRIKCELSAGLFGDEVVARIKAFGSDRKVGIVSVIVSRDNVSFGRHSSKQGTLRAYCMQEGGRVAAVVLPQASVENGQSVLVPKSQIVRR